MLVNNCLTLPTFIVVKKLIKLRNFLHFFIAYFIGKISKFSVEISNSVCNTHRFNEKREISFNFFLKGELQRLLRIGSAHNNGGLHDLKIAQIILMFRIFLNIQ